MCLPGIGRTQNCSYALRLICELHLTNETAFYTMAQELQAKTFYEWQGKQTGPALKCYVHGIKKLNSYSTQNTTTPRVT